MAFIYSANKIQMYIPWLSITQLMKYKVINRFFIFFSVLWIKNDQLGLASSGVQIRARGWNPGSGVEWSDTSVWNITAALRAGWTELSRFWVMLQLSQSLEQCNHSIRFIDPILSFFHLVRKCCMVSEYIIQHSLKTPCKHLVRSSFFCLFVCFILYNFPYLHSKKTWRLYTHLPFREAGE